MKMSKTYLYGFLALLLSGCVLSSNTSEKQLPPAAVVSEKAAQGSHFEEQLARLNAQKEYSKECFDFAICGDTQFGETFQYKPETYQIIKDWNIWRPTLAFDMGDLIFGGDAEGVPQQWDIYDKTWAPLQVPYFTLPGGTIFQIKLQKNYTSRESDLFTTD